MAIDTKDDKIKVGSKVEIVSAYFGFGKACKGDRGVVIAIDENKVNGHTEISVCIEPSNDFKGLPSWRCLINDVKLIDANQVLSEEVKEYIALHKNLAKTYDNKRRVLLNKMNTLHMEAYNLSGELTNISTLFRSYTAKHSSLDISTISNYYEVIRNNFSAISYLDMTTIKAITKPISMLFEDHDSKMTKIDMGVYGISLDVLSGKILFTHISGGSPSPIWDRYIHPHILSDGEPCLGSWYKELAVKHEAQDYIGEMLLLYNFLCEASLDGWYVDAYAFAPDNKDRCASCWRLSDDCGCERCNLCDRDYDNCTCRECPDTGDRIRRVASDYCGECEHYDTDGNACLY